MRRLSEEQKEAFERDGYLVIEEAVAPALLALLREDMAAWVEESRDHSDNYGETINGKPRFDLDPGHGRDSPALRRVNAPIEVSDAYFEAATGAYQVDAVAELIGPDLRFHHAKINAKQPASVTAVGFHQDFCFTPHSNDSLVTSLLAVDEMTAENGALEVLPGSDPTTAISGARVCTSSRRRSGRTGLCRSWRSSPFRTARTIRAGGCCTCRTSSTTSRH